MGRKSRVNEALNARKKVMTLRLAAEQGNAVAQNNLGRSYWLGEGVPEDKAEAVKWWRLAAAEQGDADAQDGEAAEQGQNSEGKQ